MNNEDIKTTSVINFPPPKDYSKPNIHDIDV